MAELEFRHELKYYISRAEYELISRRVSLTMDRDKNAGKSGKYFIRSLYFDSYSDIALNEKLSGVESRNKYRIRIYNMRDDNIKLERKHKQSSYIAKASLNITRAECEAIIAGNITVLLKRKEKLAKELYSEFRLLNLRPRVIVDYWREPYIFKVENVRVTFDMDIRTAYRATALFDGRLPTYPAQTDYGIVMEVKFNKYLPTYIHSLIQPITNGQRDAISKYCLARRYE